MREALVLGGEEMVTWKKPIPVFALAALAFVALPGPVHAQPSGDWSAPPPNSISIEPGNVREAEVVIDPDGNTIAVWMVQIGLFDRIYGAVDPAGLGDSWSAPQLLFEPSAALDPDMDMAVAPDGTVTAVWAARANDLSPDPVLWQVTKRKGATAFGLASVISQPGSIGSKPKISFGSGNQAAVVWEKQEPWAPSTLEVYLRPAGKTFSRVKRFSVLNESLFDPRVAIGPKGEILVVWSRTAPGGGLVIQRATRAAGKKTWKGPFDLTAPADSAGSPEVAIEPGGRATIAYSSASIEGGLFQRSRPAGSSSFGPAARISAPGVEVTGKSLAMGPDGTIAVAWAEGFPDSTVFASFRYPGRSSFVAPRPIISAVEPSSGDPAVAVGGARQIFVAFEAFPGPFSVPVATMKPWDSNSFEPVRALNDSPNDAFVEDIAAGENGWASISLTRLLSPSEAVLEEAAFKTERVGRPKVNWKLNKGSGLLVGTITRPAFRNFRYRVSATRGKSTAFGNCRTNYTPKRSKATCKVRLSGKGSWKVTVRESQYGVGFDTVKKTIRR